MVSFNLQSVILDDRVAEEFVGGFVELLAGGFFVRAVEVDFEVFAYVHGFYAAVAHLFEGGLHGFALRIHDRLFRRHNNFGFHRQKIEGGEIAIGDHRRKSYFASGDGSWREIFEGCVPSEMPAILQNTREKIKKHVN